MVGEAEGKAVKAVNLWRESLEVDALAQDAYMVALEELVKHICRERLEFDDAFLEESLAEQRIEPQRLYEAVGIMISPIDEDIEDNKTAPQDPPSP